MLIIIFPFFNFCKIFLFYFFLRYIHYMGDLIVTILFGLRCHCVLYEYTYIQSALRMVLLVKRKHIGQWSHGMISPSHTVAGSVGVTILHDVCTGLRMQCSDLT